MRRNNGLLYLSLFIGQSFFVFADVAPVVTDEKVWVAVKPVQCLGNPWEKDWLERHPNENYPIQDERKILRAYFGANGVTILDIRRKPFVQGTHLCQTCNCERGDTLFLSVNASEAPLLRTYGYDKVLPDHMLRQKP